MATESLRSLQDEDHHVGRKDRRTRSATHRRGHGSTYKRPLRTQDASHNLQECGRGRRERHRREEEDEEEEEEEEEKFCSSEASDRNRHGPAAELSTLEPGPSKLNVEAQLDKKRPAVQESVSGGRLVSTNTTLPQASRKKSSRVHQRRASRTQTRRSVIVHMATSDSSSGGDSTSETCLAEARNSRNVHAGQEVVFTPERPAVSLPKLPSETRRNVPSTSGEAITPLAFLRKSSHKRREEPSSTKPYACRAESSFLTQLARASFLQGSGRRGSTSTRSKASSVLLTPNEPKTTEAAKRSSLSRSVSATHTGPVGGWIRPVPVHRSSASATVSSNTLLTEKANCVACLEDFDQIIRPGAPTRFKCGHIMCDDCLKHLFELALTDAQHMPPKCCVTVTISTSHIEGIFPAKFQRTFNQKLKEFTTKNRIYCVKKECGKWIMPEKVHMDRSVGRRYGICSCGTKVCHKCNCKWHGKEECKNDPETKKFIDMAKKEGYQRCYSCKAWVELTEGCNHMSCRCKAQFCILCGSKWKSCDCPWFNTTAIEELQPFLRPAGFPLPIMAGRRTAVRQRGYQAELDARQRQERDDEALARRIMIEDWNDDFGIGVFEFPHIHDALGLPLLGDGIGRRHYNDQRLRRPPLRQTRRETGGHLGELVPHQLNQALQLQAPYPFHAPEPPRENPNVDNQLTLPSPGSIVDSHSASSDSNPPSGFHTLRRRELTEEGFDGGEGGYTPMQMTVAAHAHRHTRRSSTSKRSARRVRANGVEGPTAAAMAGLASNRTMGQGRVGLWLQHVAGGRPPPPEDEI